MCQARLNVLNSTGHKLDLYEYEISNSPDKDYAQLPTKVKNWLGLTSPTGDFVASNNRNDLASMNDEGKSFAVIADIIESNPTRFHQGYR